MAILVVIVALWKLHSHPQYYGRLGSWAETNLFGASTLGLMSEAAGQRGEGQPLAPITPKAGDTNQSMSSETNSTDSPSTQTASAPRPTNGAPLTETVSTNLLNTTGPITMIPVPASELAETPSGVAAGANVPEAASFARRLGEAGAKGGDIQISLSWQNLNDLDLHCVDPAREEICFSNPKSRNTHGELDVDQNAREPFNSSPVENIFWPSDGAPGGLYRIYVVYYARHCEVDTTPFLIRTVVRGTTNFFRGSIRYTGLRERLLICNLRYDPSNPDPAKCFRFENNQAR